ncbi:MAG: NAD(P)/FAD-dependent oxidoreductase [Actinomycetota bacterium]|nr:NAD(P)/FAD-dependent oxidoreductase [Actinomycetota bacterium]
MTADRYDAVVVGSGPNGLAAAVRLAEAGCSVLVLEAAGTIGGGTRSAEVTLPGFVHDICAAVHALGVSAPALSLETLGPHGLEWVWPEIPLAHPLDGGRAGVLHRRIDETAAGLGADGPVWRRLMQPLVDDWSLLLPQLLGPLLSVPRHPVAIGRFGLRALQPATWLTRKFHTDEAAALFGGCAAHAMLTLSQPLTSAFGLMLAGSAHAGGWPVAAGGSQAVADALAARLGELEGEVRTGVMVRSLADLPPHRVALFDTNPAQLASIAGDALPARYRERLRRFRHGPGAFKIDYALDGPVPWEHEACRRAGTLHVVGTLAELIAAEADVAAGRMPDRPFVLVVQQSVFDPTRAPAGKHTLWAYAHVPHGYAGDATDAIERQIERFAPGFGDIVLARHVTTPRDLHSYNANYVGGDITGGAHTGLQLVFRPTITARPYATPNPSLFLCSASTPPGAGVHGMCGWHAAGRALAGPLRRGSC